MQELRVRNVDDVAELCNNHPLSCEGKVAPEEGSCGSKGKSVGSGNDWERILCRSRPEDNLIHLRSGNVVAVKSRPKWERTLSQMHLSDLDLGWPPTPAEVIAFAGRQRRRLAGANGTGV